MDRRVGPIDPPGTPQGYGAILDLPDTVVGELINGELVVSPRPSPPQAVCAANLNAIVNSVFGLGIGGPGGWWILMEPELHLAGDVVVPDLAGWRRERLPETPAEAYFTLPPDWVCEVLSPKSAKHDRVSKLDIYRRHSVPFYWIIDPIRRTLEVLALHDARWAIGQTLGDDDAVCAPPFEATTFQLTTLWPAGVRV